MADLISKLNVLVRSSIHSVLGDEAGHRQRRGELPSLSRLGKDIDAEIVALRQQVDKALDDEDRMTADIQALRRQIADWDQQADQALARGDEVTARHAIRQMQIHEQRATMLEADLAQHRVSASELIQRVNELDAVVAAARRRQQEMPASDEDADEEPLSARLCRVRQQIQTQEMEAVPQEAPPITVDDAAVNDDLARRRARLSQ